MAKTTIVYFDGIRRKDKTTRIFKTLTPRKNTIWVKAFDKGIAKIDIIDINNITDAAEIVAGCFDEDSNFENELRMAFNCTRNTTLKSIEFEFNDVTIMVTRKNADKCKIFIDWNEAIEANVEKERLEREAYMKTAEYRAERAKELKRERRMESVQNDIIIVDTTTEIKFKNKKAAKKWKKFVKINSRGQSETIVIYASRWAKYMQYLMEKHNKTVAEIALNSSELSDIEGIMSGAAFGCALGMLIECWVYGEELEKWYNQKLEDEKRLFPPC